MAGEIATAFIRISPEMSGFESETASGVKSAFSGIGKLIAGTFVIGEGLRFGNEIVQGAAQVQKSVETIRAEFGQAGDAVAKFGETGAAKLGISANVADSVSARFGILFKNLGIGQKQAAGMTVRFEKLAGSIASIRGIDPATVLQNLPLAAAGNVRALKQLGIAVDQNQLKVIAFRLGLTQTINQALTPGQRAIAIYTVATQNLDGYQKQAAAHAGDLANVQRRLSAEWADAKDKLGTALLPYIARFATFLADKLPGAIDNVRTKFKQFGDAAQRITGPIGGLKGVLEGLLGAFAVGKVIAFSRAITGDLVARGFVALRVSAEADKAAFIEAFGAGEIAAIGLSATIRSALISTGFGALAVAAGFAAEYIINHWSQVKRVLETIATGLKTVFNVAWAAIKETGKAAAYYLLEYFSFAIREILDLASHLPFVGKYAKEALDAIQRQIDRFKPDWSNVTAAARVGGTEGGNAYGTSFSQAAGAAISQWATNQQASLAALSKLGFNSDLLTGKTITDKGKVVSNAVSKAQEQVSKLNTTLNGLNATQAAGILSAQTAITNLQSNLAASIQKEQQDIVDSVNQAKQNLQSIMSTLSADIGQIIDAPLQRLQDRLNLQQNKLTLEQLRRSVLLPGGRSLSSDPTKALAELRRLAGSANAISRPAIQSFLLQYQQAALGVQQAQATITKRNVDVSLGNLASQFNRGQITLAQFKTRLLASLKREGVGYKTAGALLGNAFADGFQGQVQGLLMQAAEIAKSPHVAGAGQIPSITRPLLTIQQDQRDIAKQQRDLTAKQNGLIAKQNKYAERQTQLLGQIAAADKVINGSSATKNPGSQSTKTRKLNRAG